MAECANCIRLTRELREAREEVEAWADMRKGKKSVQDNFPERMMLRNDALNRVEPLMRAYSLSPIEAKAVEAVMSRAGEVVEKTDVFQAMQCAPHTGAKIVDIVICRARKKLPPKSFATVWGIGYRMTIDAAVVIRAAMENAK